MVPRSWEPAQLHYDAVETETQGAYLDRSPHFSSRALGLGDVERLLVDDAYRVRLWCYADGSCELRVTPKVGSVHRCVQRDRDRVGVRRSDSVRRSVKAILRHAAMAGVRAMVTFTFPKPISTSDEALSLFSVFFVRYLRRFPSLRSLFRYMWLVVPEPHRSGSWHLHVLTNCRMHYRLECVLRSAWTKFLRSKGIRSDRSKRVFVHVLNLRENDIGRYVTKYVAKTVRCAQRAGVHLYRVYGCVEREATMVLGRGALIDLLCDLFQRGASFTLLTIDGGWWRCWVLIVKWKVVV